MAIDQIRWLWIGEGTYRAEVPGGWLYRYASKTPVFVPDPNPVTIGYGDAMKDLREFGDIPF